IGGTETLDMDRYGFVEAGVHLAWPELGLRWRNLAWQGDTVYHQARPLHYYTQKGDSQPGSIPDHRERTEPGIVFVCFGKMESLAGEERLPDFVAAYAKLLDDLAPLTGRIVLVEPTPFFHSGPAGNLADARNVVLAAYAEAIGTLAKERNLLFLRAKAEWNAGMSDDGVHLNEGGHRVFADALLDGLGAMRKPEAPPALSDAIDRKNRLWQQYYRPTNWAFLFGDRQHVPASRDVEKREERWFVREIDSLPALIAESEADIQRYAKEAAR
ncbi:MAG TPA: GDSL-type esterase/lipase family protein, partial [Bacteroidia bacterium]|nr:GDSL-type esterase/lipase family protein [Bacteroidia bacterium]